MPNWLRLKGLSYVWLARPREAHHHSCSNREAHKTAWATRYWGTHADMPKHQERLAHGTRPSIGDLRVLIQPSWSVQWDGGGMTQRLASGTPSAMMMGQGRSAGGSTIIGLIGGCSPSHHRFPFLPPCAHTYTGVLAG